MRKEGKNRLTALLIILIGVWAHVLHAQPSLSFRYLDYRDGLPDFADPHAMIQDHLGRLWLATDKGLFMYDGHGIINFPPNIQDSSALSEQTVFALHLHADSTIWIGTRNLGICIYHPGKGSFSRILPIAEGGSLPVRGVREFYRDRKGIVWISSDEGLVKCDSETMEFTLYQYEAAGISDTLRNYINTLREVSDDPEDEGRLWICTRAGLVSFLKETGEFTIHAMPYNSAEVGFAELDYMLIEMEWTTPQDLWLTSWAGGMMHFNTATSQWARYRDPSADPLYDISYTLSHRNEKEFWYTSYGGAGVFNHQSGTYHPFLKEHNMHGGLKTSSFYHAQWVTHDGILVIAGTSGLSFSTQAVRPMSDQTVVKPIISEIRLNHLPILSKESDSYMKRIAFEAGENTLSFTCAWPSYDVKTNAQFRFKLEGYEEDWNYNGNSRKVQYTNLPPGRFVFLYETTLDEKNWVAGLTKPHIIVSTPFIKSGGFVSMVVVFILAFLTIIYNMRIRQIRRESRLRTDFAKKLAENEMTALRAQMNPHFMFNSLNSIKNYILKENTTEASKYLTKFSHLMRAILKNSRHTLITLEDEITALTLYIEMEAMRFNHEFSYSIMIDPSLQSADLFVPPLLLQPYVENAIWHGLMRKEGNRNLEVRVIPERDKIHIIIEDNGVGRQAAASRKVSENGTTKSYGMQITRDRIELINRTLGIHAEVEVEDLTDEYGNPGGTRVALRIPAISEGIAETIENGRI